MKNGSAAALPHNAAFRQVKKDEPVSTDSHKRPATRRVGGFYLKRRVPLAYSALDLGTNNCRLLIAEPDANGFRVIDAFSRIVCLGQGISQTQCISEEAIERTLEALAVCRSKIQAQKASKVRLVATEACRMARNGKEFVARVRKEVGLNLEIISQRTEARLATAGCASLVDPNARSVIIFDIGGGSTEITWLKGRIASLNQDPCHLIRAWDSLPVGVVPLAERYADKALNGNVFEDMVQDVMLLLQPFTRMARQAMTGRNVHLLGASGTVTTIGGIFLDLPRYNRMRVDGMWMKQADVSRVIDRLSRMSFEERMAHRCIGPERAELVVAGCAILEAIRRVFPCERLRVADRGLREGILMNMMRKDRVWDRHKAYSSKAGRADKSDRQKQNGRQPQSQTNSQVNQKSHSVLTALAPASVK